jgi:hypothetical protein
MFTRLHRLVCLVVVVAGCAQNIPRDQALARANAAHARGDIVSEALALREACGFARDDKDLCKRGEQAWAAAQVSTQQNARKVCGALDSPTAVDTCLAAVGEIRKLAPSDPEAAQLAAAAAKQHTAYCTAEAPEWQKSIDDGIELVRCEDARAAQINLPSYAQQIAEARGATRDLILALVDRPDLAGHLGAAAELVTSASCLAGGPELGQRAASARTSFIDRSRASIDLRATTSMALPGLCASVATGLGSRAVCGSPRANAPQLTVAGEITLAPVEHAAFDTTESVEYVAGIIRFPNPEYQPAVEAERFARDAKNQAETHYRHDESDCNSAESTLRSQSSCTDCTAKADRDRACNQSRSSEQLWRQRQRDFDDASRHLSQTRPIEERKDIRTAVYSVRHHSWRATWRAQLRNDGKQIAGGGETVASDLETSGAPIAGVAADPLTPPGDRWMVPPIRDQVAAKIVEILHQALGRRASDAAVNCSGELAWAGDWLDCWARVRLWSGAPAEPDALIRTVGEARDRRRGAAWPPLRCF